MTDISSKTGGIDRSHDSSLWPKRVFASLHGIIVLACLWVAFGGGEWPDGLRAKVLALCALLYFLRHLVTLFVLLQRRVEMSEVWGLLLFMAIFEVGFLLLGAGGLSGQARPFRPVDWAGIGLVLCGSYLNTGSELQRRKWKQNPASKGHCYTGGLFAYSAHINYFGDSVLFTGWAILAASAFAFAIPIMMTLLFIFFHIPALDTYLAERYGDEFKTYAGKTAKFMPFVY
ncbi:DUF1295 domain-containing protein [uncultured Litoreibacter sp.]|uniref:DUF1295 domain-containing protein n=1 Tax=uncultured Litoreibacter sp. TaxID=1392394 RepID=UPI00262DE11E|nr:DUF1295 domain-containing protein [uncultured Litoreibacter sp.]